MSRSIDLARAALGTLAMASLLFASAADAAGYPGFAATQAYAQAPDPKLKKQAPPPKKPQRAPARVIMQPKSTGPKVVTPKVNTQLRRAPSSTAVKKVAPVVATPKIAAPVTGTPKAVRTFNPRGPKSRVVTAARIRSIPPRGPGRYTIAGRNYSAWRGSYRIRHGNGWWTFVALSTLGALAIGASQYYPYAYIDAPEPYCDGLTEDGCQLVYENVQTIEGDVVGQCVAYCPWQ